MAEFFTKGMSLLGVFFCFCQWSRQHEKSSNLLLLCAIYSGHFLCHIPLAMQDIPSRTIVYPSQQFRAAVPGQVRDGIKFLCKTEVLLPGFRRNYFCPFNEEEYCAGWLIRDCVSISLGCPVHFLCYIWVLRTRLTEDSKLFMFFIQNSPKFWNPAIPKSGSIFWSI